MTGRPVLTEEFAMVMRGASGSLLWGETQAVCLPMTHKPVSIAGCKSSAHYTIRQSRRASGLLDGHGKPGISAVASG
jgi:hypothetical protein